MRNLAIFLLGMAYFGFANTAAYQESPSTLMQAGVANEVYRVHSSTSKPYILKVFHRKAIEELDRVESLLQLVRNAGIAIPESIIPPVQVGSKVVSVFSYVNGHHIDDTHLSQVAKLMGKLHSIQIAETADLPLKDYSRLFENCRDWALAGQLESESDSSLHISAPPP